MGLGAVVYFVLAERRRVQVPERKKEGKQVPFSSSHSHGLFPRSFQKGSGRGEEGGFRLVSACAHGGPSRAPWRTPMYVVQPCQGRYRQGCICYCLGDNPAETGLTVSPTTIDGPGAVDVDRACEKR